MDVLIIAVLTLLTFLNIIAPYSGTAVITPLLLGVTGDVQKSITLALFYFAMGGIVRIVVFRKFIQWEFVKMLVPVSMVGALLGAVLSVEVPVTILLVIMAFVTGSYLINKIKDKKKKQPVKQGNGTYLVGLFTGFLQGTGVVGGSDMRNGYLFSKGLGIAEVGATTAVVGVSNFAVALIYRGFQGTVGVPEIAQLLVLLPFVIVATVAGKRVLFKINKRVQDGIIYTVLVVSLIFVVYRLIIELTR